MLRKVKGVNNFIVYCYTNTVTGEQYVGQTCQTLKERAGDCGIRYMDCGHFGHAIREYGWRNFASEILKENLTQEEADYWEKYYIEERKTREKGYNRTPGGQGKRGITRYSFDGKCIASYKSASDAWRNCYSLDAKTIRDLCNRKPVSLSGLLRTNDFWVFTDERPLSFPVYIPSRVLKTDEEKAIELLFYKIELYGLNDYQGFYTKELEKLGCKI